MVEQLVWGGTELGNVLSWGKGFQLWSVKLHSLGVFASFCLECHLVVVVVFHH